MRLLYYLVLLPLVACIDPPEVEPIEQKPACSRCPNNSPELAANPFYWVHRDRTRGGDGVEFVEFLKGKKAYPLDVNRTVLRYWGDDQQWHSGQELNGSVIRVEMDGTKYDVKINEFGTGLPYWTQFNSGAIETYIMSWKKTGDPDSKFQDFCPAETGQFAGAEHKEAVIFEGDHYDPVTLDITKTDMTDFVAPFNMSCVGTLPSKMALTRRTAATSLPFFPSQEDDSQALVRVWAAQYCGGQIHTVPGHRIRIVDERGWMKPEVWGWRPFEPVAIEAVWNSKGAVCWETPRLATYDPTDDSDTEMTEKATTECKLTKCSEQQWFINGDWRSHGQFLTATVKSPILVAP